MSIDMKRSQRPKLFPPLALAFQPISGGRGGLDPLPNPLSGHQLRRIVADMIG